jgi:hypothetical protein
MASLMAILVWARWPTAPGHARHLAVIHRREGRVFGRGAFKATPTRCYCLHSLLPSLLSPSKRRTKPPSLPQAPMSLCACTTAPPHTKTRTQLHLPPLYLIITSVWSLSQGKGHYKKSGNPWRNFFLSRISEKTSICSICDGFRYRHGLSVMDRLS